MKFMPKSFPAFLIVTVIVVLSARPIQAQTLTTLYSFKGAPDGNLPEAALVRDSVGNFYGTTVVGGTGTNCYFGPIGCGTVFKVDNTGKETVLYSFTGGADGSEPTASLILDAEGNLYGTTSSGGADGVVFKLDTSGNESVLYNFTGGADGGEPAVGLIRDPEGNFYGTTSAGGNAACNDGEGCGVVFKLDTTGNETVLYAFCQKSMCADGEFPYGEVIRDARGSLYGTTVDGGSNANCTVSGGCGIVFKLDTTGKETVLHSFGGAPDGEEPYGSLIRDGAGNLVGITVQGGDVACNDIGLGCGIVFKINASGEETVLYTFTGGAAGAYRLAGLIRDAKGNLYGTTETGGGGCAPDGCGVVFALDPSNKETVLHTFTGPDGEAPRAGLISDGKGNGYGTTSEGGAGDFGSVFEITR